MPAMSLIPIQAGTEETTRHQVETVLGLNNNSPSEDISETCDASSNQSDDNDAEIYDEDSWIPASGDNFVDEEDLVWPVEDITFVVTSYHSRQTRAGSDPSWRVDDDNDRVGRSHERTTTIFNNRTDSTSILNPEPILPRRRRSDPRLSSQGQQEPSTAAQPQWMELLSSHPRSESLARPDRLSPCQEHLQERIRTWLVDCCAHEVTEEEDQECGICRAGYGDGDRGAEKGRMEEKYYDFNGNEVVMEDYLGGAVSLDCGHVAHADCLARWLACAPTPTCPTCRAGVELRWFAWDALHGCRCFHGNAGDPEW